MNNDDDITPSKYRRAAEEVRAMSEADFYKMIRPGLWAQEEMADMFDASADEMEDEEEEDDETLRRRNQEEIQAIDGLLDLLKRYDAGSLGSLIRRYEPKSEK